MSNWTIPEELLVENGGNIIKIENSDGSISYKPVKVKYGVGDYTGKGMPDMSRKTERAGKTVEEDGFALTYDALGYCTEARNLNWVVPENPETEGGHWKN